MKENYLRVPITMPAEMVEALEAMSLKAKVAGVANTELVRAAVNILLKSEIDISGCKSEEEVESKLFNLIK